MHTPEEVEKIVKEAFKSDIDESFNSAFERTIFNCRTFFLEERLNVGIPGEELRKITTVDGLIEAFKKRVNKQKSGQ